MSAFLGLDQGCQTQFLQSLDATLIKHLFQLIKSFKLIWKLHGTCVRAELEQNSAGLRLTPLV